MKKLSLTVAVLATMGSAYAQDIPAVMTSPLENAVNFASQYELDGARPDVRKKLQAQAAKDAQPKVEVSSMERAKKAANTRQEVKSPRTTSTAQTNKARTVPEQSFIHRGPKINVTPGQNAVIEIARDQPNRLLTPFKSPRILTADLSPGKGDACGEICARGSVVYVTTDQDKPVTLFITEENREDIAISLTLVPARVAPRQVEVILPNNVMDDLRSNGASRVGGDAEEAKAWERAQPYVEMLKESMREVALGKVPQGYSMRNVNNKDAVPICRQQGLNVSFKKGQVIEGHDITIFVGTIKNTSNEPVEFNEQRCGYWNVAAVASFPLKVLKPNQMTEVYVAVKRDKPAPAASVRRTLIDRQFE